MLCFDEVRYMVMNYVCGRCILVDSRLRLSRNHWYAKGDMQLRESLASYIKSIETLMIILK